jgi:hypothetical protein
VIVKNNPNQAKEFKEITGNKNKRLEKLQQIKKQKLNQDLIIGVSLLALIPY